MYEESLRTPLIVRWPGVVKPGVENTDIVSNLDFAETFLDIAGARVPGDMQGASLVPVLRGATPKDWRKTFYYHYYESGGHGVPIHFGVTTRRHKLIRFQDKGLDAWELFDLLEDPQEMNSVYGKPEYAKVANRLKREMERLRKKFNVTDTD